MSEPAPAAGPETPWRLVLALAGARRLALILALMFAVALTEGFGLLLMVPILQSLEPGAAPGGIAAWLPLGGQPLAALRSRCSSRWSPPARWRGAGNASRARG